MLGLSPLVEIAIIISETIGSLRKQIDEIIEEKESCFTEHLNQLRLNYPLIDQIIKFVEMGLAQYEVVRSFTQVHLSYQEIDNIKMDFFLGFLLC